MPDPNADPVDHVSSLRPTLEAANGAELAITERLFDYYLNVLPPAAMPFHWRGKRYAFAFAEGADLIFGFRHDASAGSYFAVLTDVRNRG